MSDTPTPSDDRTGGQQPNELPIDPGVAAPGQLLSPGAARRRLAGELKSLREATGGSAANAGAAIERSPATISRFESAKYTPRLVEVTGLLDHYATLASSRVTNELRARILSLATEARKKEWFEPFKDAKTGDMLPAHWLQFVGYETDADGMRNYEPDLIPGLLQTFEYAHAIARTFFPNRPTVDHDRFAEFRLARLEQLRRRSDVVRLSFVVNEIALRRDFGDRSILAAQIDALVRLIEDGQEFIDLRVVPMSTTVPAAFGGSFVILYFSEEFEDQEIVYLESRSGAKYLTTEDEVERYNSYYENLVSESMSDGDAVRLMRSIISPTS